MVSSYLICDLCGGFGPPASFLSENGLRLCYQCWYREHGGDDSPSVTIPEAAAEPTESLAVARQQSPVQSAAVQLCPAPVATATCQRTSIRSRSARVPPESR